MFEDDLSLQPKTTHERSGGDPRVETDTPPLDHMAGEGKELSTLAPNVGPPCLAADKDIWRRETGYFSAH